LDWGVVGGLSTHILAFPENWNCVYECFHKQMSFGFLQALDTVEAEVEGLAACCNRCATLLKPFQELKNIYFMSVQLQTFSRRSGREDYATFLEASTH
jgi:hypothetical protein